MNAVSTSTFPDRTAAARHARAGLLALLFNMLVCTTLGAWAGDLRDEQTKAASLPQTSAVVLSASELVSASPRSSSNKQGHAIAMFASAGLIERGIQNSTEALLACQREDGGVFGLSKLPSGRSSSRIDHCFR